MTYRSNNSPFKKGHKLTVGEKHPMYKGDNVGYSGAHRWLTNHHGNPPKCELCGQEGEYRTRFSKKYGKVNYWSLQWANISGTYTRYRDDYSGMCKSCHMNHDKASYANNRVHRKIK